MDIKIPFQTRNLAYKMALLLFVLAIFDALLTDFGIRNHHIEEANPLMRFVYESSVLYFFVIKISLPILLLYILTKIEPKIFLNVLVASSVLLYTLVLFQHIFWLILVAIT
ncbi:DUF5658 family protein [Sporosarcina sp. CAU 1771]